MTTVYRLFISHGWEAGEAYSRFVSTLDAIPSLEWENTADPEAGSANLGESQGEALLRQQMADANAVVILADVYEEHPEWVRRELALARDEGKPIIVVQPWGARTTPDSLREAGDVLVGWNSERLIMVLADHAT
jgi:hypothetical protein